MVIAVSLKYLSAPAERNVLGVFSHMPLLTERNTLFTQGYKHLAPPEQKLEQLA